ncbi:MAG: VCBS repeat-containing protein [Actinomycetota bacterium]|nr:VCBS repeat-containing protein [Actinomycetota bacterium]
MGGRTQTTVRGRGPGRRGLATVLVGATLMLALLASGVGSAGAAVVNTRRVQPASGGFLDTQVATWAPSLAVDPAGGVHVAVNRWTPNFSAQRGTYAYCPPRIDCGLPVDWAQVHLVPSVHELTGPPQLQLTAAGQPRLLFTVGDVNNLTTYRYAACDSGCNSAANWTVLDLGPVFNKPGDIWGVHRDHSFALDPQGRPRFVYSFQDASGTGRLYYAACDDGCAASVANWSKTTVSHGTGEVGDVASVHYDSLSLDFTAAGHPRVAGYSIELPFFGPEVENIAYLECDGNCSAPEPETGPNPNWRVTAVADRHGGQLVMRLDNADTPHIMAGGQEALYAQLRWLWCAGACSTPSSWSSAAVGISGSDPDLTFDRQNQPHVVFKGDVGGPDIAYAWCTAGCDAAGAPWKVQQVDDNRAHQAQIPLPGSPCSTGTWLVGYRPALTLDPAGNPRVAFEGHHVYNDCSGNLRTNGRAVRVDRFNFYPRPADFFDGSVGTDVSVFRPSSGTWFTRGGNVVSFGTTGDIPVPADYDGSGYADIAVFRPSNGVWFVQGGAVVAFGTTGDIPVPADYDGDGKADIAVFRPSNGVWFVRQSTGGTTVTAYGANGDIPVPGDYDGDHVADIAVFRPGNGVWFVHNSSGGDSVAAYGANGDVPVPGDYDADGDTDIAVFRPSNAYWFVQGGSVTQYGTSGDVPAPGDYDGDGTTDIAVFRPSNGYWFVSGGPITQFGTSGDVPLPLPTAIQRFVVPSS